MSLYTDYQKKIAPWAKAWHFVVKHKVLILSACVAVFVATGTLLGIKGIVIDDGLNADMKFGYGQEIDLDGNAIMGDVYYEYRAAGSDEWSEVKPSDAGTYEVRACSRNSFGGAYYSGYKTFTIAKKDSPLSIDGTELVYGEKPSLSMELIPGDQIASFDYVFDDIDKDKPLVTVKDLVIKNGVGKDVTENYAFSLPSKEMTLLPRPITIKGNDIVEQYNGRPIEGGDYQITAGTLAEGDKIVVTHNDLPVFSEDVVENLTGVKIENSGGKDVTKHYNLSLIKGSISIIKRNLTISSKSFTKQYDGKPFTSIEYPTLETYTLSNELAAGDSISVSFSAQDKSAPGFYSNEFSFTLDNQENYAITKDVGTLTITRRKLTLDFENELVYDGRIFGERVDDIYTSDGLLPGHRLEVALQGERLGRAYVDVNVYSETNEDVTDYYDIVQNGWTDFKPRQLTITCENYLAKYDGQEHSASYTVDGLLGCDAIEFYGETPRATYPCSVDYTLSVKKIYNSETGESRTSYYDVNVIPGYFAIKPRDIDIQLSVDRKYSGYAAYKSPFVEGEEYVVGGDGLASGDTLEIYGILNNSNYDLYYSIFNAHGEDVTHTCYEVANISGSWKFSKAPLRLSVDESQIITYDGEYHNAPLKVEGLQNGDRLVPSAETYRDAYSDYYLSFDSDFYDHIESEDGEDVTEFYDITCVRGSFSIYPRELTVDMHPHRTYDGTDECMSTALVEGEDYTITDGELLENHVLLFEVSDIEAFYDNDEDNVYTEPKVIDSVTGESVGQNYVCNLYVNYANQKANLHVKSIDVDVVYDGYQHAGWADAVGLAEGDSIVYQDGSIPSSVKPYYEEYEVLVSMIPHSSNSAYNYDRSAFYNITSEPAVFQIRKRDVSIDIAPHSDPAIWRYSSGSDQLADTDVLDITPRIGSGGTMEYDVKIYNGDGEDVTQSCYNLTVNNLGTERYYYSLATCIDDTPSSRTALYDGYRHYFSTQVTKDASLNDSFNTKVMASGDVNGLYENHALSAYAPCEITADPVLSSITGTRYSLGAETTGDTSMFYYDPTSSTSATLKILKRDLDIVLSGSRTYEGTPLGYELVSSEYALGGDGLAPTDEITITPIEDTILTGKSVQYQISIYNTVLKEDVTDCYDIDLDATHMLFDKCFVTLTSSPEDNTWVYDGEAHNPVVEAMSPRGDDVVTVSTDISDAGGKTDVGTYDYEVTGYTVTQNGEDVTKYYGISNPDYESSITIEKADLYLDVECRNGFDTSTYNSLADLMTGYEITTTANVTYDFSTATFDAVPSTPGTYNVEDYLRGGTVLKDGVDVTSNFNIHIQGTFKIVQAKLTIGAPSYSVTYTGEEIFGDVERCFIIFTEGMKEEGYHVTDIVLEGSLTEPGSITLTIVDYTIVDGNGNVVNMPVTELTGTLTVVRRSLTICTSDVYDFVDEPVSPGKPYISSGSLAPGHSLYFYYTGSYSAFGAAGEYPNDSWVISIVDENGNDVSGYYDLTVLYGTFYIEE